jgi:hypothetical protein
MKLLLGLIFASVTIAIFTHAYLAVVERTSMADKHRATYLDRITR